jgi:Mitochondrial ribosome protein 63
MFITLPCFFKKTVPGHIFRGKRRLVQRVTFKQMQIQINAFKLQENNMMLLKRPYLTLVSIKRAHKKHKL